MKNRIKKIFFAMLAFLLIGTMLNPMAVYGAVGTIQVQLRELEVAQSDREGVAFDLYQVGSVSKTGEPVIEEKYGISVYPVHADETEQAVKKIQKLLDVEPQQSGVTDAEGCVTFSGLADGVYYIQAAAPNAYGIVEGLLVQIPYSSVVPGVGNQLMYTIQAEPKAAPNQTPTVTPTDTPSKPGEVTPTGTPSTLGGNPAKTGDNSMMGVYFAMMGISMFMFLWAKRKANIE